MNIMVVRVCVVLLSLVSATLSFAARAQTEQTAQAPAAAAKVDPRVAIASRMPGVKPEDLRATPVPNIYEVTHGAEIGYVTADGRYSFGGDLVDLVKSDDLTEDRRRDLRVAGARCGS